MHYKRIKQTVAYAAVCFYVTEGFTGLLKFTKLIR